jgi:hypothetical protein
LEFLTKETLIISAYNGDTPLHYAALYGHLDQIPDKFLTPEFLSITADFQYGGKMLTGDTVFHILAKKNQLSMLPSGCMTPDIWDLKGLYDETVREALESEIQRKADETRVRNEPATEKQKDKLRYFESAFDEKITKGQASDALDKCARDFPEVERAYYGHPATEEQMAKIRAYLKDTPDEIEESYTYGEAKDLIRELAMEARAAEEQKFSDEMAKVAERLRRDMW